MIEKHHRARLSQGILRFLSSVASLCILYVLVCKIAAYFLPPVSAFLPSLPALAKSIVTLVTTGELWGSLGITSGRVLCSLGLTVLVGLPLGLVIGAFPRVYSLLRPGWDFLRSIPPSALFPLLVLLLGIGWGSKLATTWFTTTLIYAVGVADAASIVRRTRGRFYTLVGVQRTDWFLAVLLPEAFLRSVSSLRIVVSITVALMIVCEMFLGKVDGYGGLLMQFTDALNYSGLLAAIVIVGLLGYLFNAAIDAMERIAIGKLQQRTDP